MLKKAEGKWPGFGAAVSKYASKNKDKVRLPFELWPSHYADLSRPVQQFLDRQLSPALKPFEKERLFKAEKQLGWPAYPETIQELAIKHRLKVPWFVLPGPREHWDAVRARAWEKP